MNGVDFHQYMKYETIILSNIQILYTPYKICNILR